MSQFSYRFAKKEDLPLILEFIKELAEYEKMLDEVIATEELLNENLAENCIPDNIFEMTVENYDDFLQERRKLMAKLIQGYYEGL